MTAKGTVHGPYGNDPKNPEDFEYVSPSKEKYRGNCRLKYLSGGASSSTGKLIALLFNYNCVEKVEAASDATLNGTYIIKANFLTS